MSGVRQFKRSYDPFDGVAQSVITSSIMFFGDAAMITGSLTTSSATASRWTLEGYDGSATDGFSTTIPAASANGWNNIKTLTGPGYFSLDTIPSWARVLRTPSHSSITLFISVHVGP